MSLAFAMRCVLKPEQMEDQTGASHRRQNERLLRSRHGGRAFQWPIGWAADRFERRRLLALAGAFSAAAPLAMVALGPAYPRSPPAWWSGAARGRALHAGADELGARYRGAVLAEGNAAVILAYGIGALVSPVAFGTAMEIVRPDGLLWLAALAYLGLAATRIRGARSTRAPTGP